MWRLKFFRILLPALLLPFIVVLVLTFRERPAPKTPADAAKPFSGPRAEGIELTDLAGGAMRLKVKAQTVQQDETGRLHLEGIERLVIPREAAPPLVVSAARGSGETSGGKRFLRLEGGVNVHEDESGLAVSLPTLEVDEASGEARSVGEVSVEDPSYRGRAASVVYGLRRQGTVWSGLAVDGKDGSRLTAQSARFLDGPRDLELSGEVRAAGRGWSLAAGRLRLKRDADGRLRSAAATEEAAGGRTAPDGQEERFSAERVEAAWDSEGRPESVFLDGGAHLARGSDELDAARIEGKRSAADARWEVVGRGSLRAKGLWNRAPAVVHAETLNTVVDPHAGLERAELDGDVRFEGGGSAGDAAHLTFLRGGANRATLLSGPGRRARLARDRTRVAADSLTTDPAGKEILAQGRVESTLLPAPSATSGETRAGGLFVEGQAVHFVSARLTSSSADSRLVFDGSVRGWQGDRNLSADHVEVRQQPEELHARGSVTTRIPRERGTAASEADYVKVAADVLDYTAAERKAVYTGSVRARQAEGWLEAGRLDVELAPEGGSIREMLASGAVRFEFHSSATGSMPQPVTGEGDRVEYIPGENVIRLFGDEAPATVRRTGPQGGTTTGRVLRYRLDSGSIEVESGERNRARIRTSGR